MEMKDCAMTDEIFSFQGDDGIDYVWNTTKLYEAVVSGKVKAEKVLIPVDSGLSTHVASRNGVNITHAMTISKDRLSVPLLAVEMPDRTSILVDGNHRVVRAWTEGVTELPGYVVLLEDARPYEVAWVQSIARTT